MEDRLEQIDDIVATVLDVCRVEAITVGTYRDARRLAERYRISWHDATIAASVVAAGRTALNSEDFSMAR